MNTMETARQKRDLQEWLPVPSFQGPQIPQEPEAVLLPAVLPVREAVHRPIHRAGGSLFRQFS